MSKPKKVLFAILLGLVGLLVVINWQSTEIHYLPIADPIKMPLFLALFVFFGAGVVTGLMWAWIKGGKKKEPDKP